MTNDSKNDPLPGEEMRALERLLDTLPIYATRIGYRYDSSTAEREFGDKVFELHSRWNELQGRA